MKSTLKRLLGVLSALLFVAILSPLASFAYLIPPPGSDPMADYVDADGSKYTNGNDNLKNRDVTPQADGTKVIDYATLTPQQQTTLFDAEAVQHLPHATGLIIAMNMGMAGYYRVITDPGAPTHQHEY